MTAMWETVELAVSQAVEQASDNSLPIAIIGVVGTVVSLVIAPIVQKLVTSQGHERDRLTIAIDYIVEMHEAWGQKEPPEIPAELQARPRRTAADLARLARRRDKP